MNKKNILIVEDDLNLKEALIDKLVEEGFNVLSANDGQEGLKIALKSHPQLILLDIVMPKMDGITMLKKLRQDNWGANAAVIMLTNINENDKLANALEIGIDEYFVKAETRLEHLLSRIRSILGTD